MRMLARRAKNFQAGEKFYYLLEPSFFIAIENTSLGYQ